MFPGRDARREYTYGEKMGRVSNSMVRIPKVRIKITFATVCPSVVNIFEPGSKVHIFKGYHIREKFHRMKILIHYNVHLAWDLNIKTRFRPYNIHSMKVVVGNAQWVFLHRINQ